MLVVRDHGYWSVVTFTRQPTGDEAEKLSKLGAHFWWEYHDKALPPKPALQVYGWAFWSFCVRTQDLPEFHARLALHPIN